MGKKGTFSISGESHLPNLQVILAGRDIQFKIPRRLDFLGDANLQLGGTMDRPDLSGKLSVRRGTYEVPPKKKEGPPAPRTAADEFEESFWQNMHLNVAAQWPGNVWYRDGLSKIESQADIRVMKESGTKQIYLSGVLTLVRGSYNVYGRDFVIKSGELTFRGPPDIDPNIQIEAEYKTDEVTVELQVSGTASQPKLTLTSTPPMTQPEILSYLATGISSVRGSELNKSGGSPVSGGSTLAAGVLSSYLTNEVRASGLNVLQLDVLRVTPTANGNVWTVGRYLGPKFFFSYSTNSKDTANKVVNGEYMLSPRWSLVGQTGSNTDDYLDIQFRVPWVRKEKKKPEPDKK